MENRFFEQPILNSPYEYPSRHWELNAQGQPTQRIIDARRRAEFIAPIPKPKKQNGAPSHMPTTGRSFPKQPGSCSTGGIIAFQGSVLSSAGLRLWKRPFGLRKSPRKWGR